MDNTNVQVQQEFIQKIVDDKKHVNVFLINGVKLQGLIEGHDNYTIVVSGNKGNSAQLVFKHAISTIQLNG